MQLPSTLAWLVDAAGALPGADRLLAELGARLVADGVPLAGGALTLAVPHPIIAHRTWLWRADTGAVIEALGFAASGISGEPTDPPGDAGRSWLAGLGTGPVHENIVGPEDGRAGARLDRVAPVHARGGRPAAPGRAFRRSAACGACGARRLERGARGLSRPA